jgi:hypothetical protein
MQPPGIKGKKEVWGGTLLLGFALTPFSLAGPVLAALATYQSWDESTPWGSVWAFSGSVIDAMANLLNRERQWLDVPVERVNGAIANQGPLSEYFRFQGIQNLGTDWLLELSSENNLALLGDQGEGKSYALRYLAYHFVKRHQGNCRLYVHDIEDGFGHGERFNWFGLERNQYLFTEPDDLPRILRAVMEDADGLPTLILIDEVNNAMDELSDEQKQDAQKAFKAIRNRGKKRKVQFVVGTQDNNVEDLGLNTAAIRKMVWVIYPKMARFKTSYRNLDLDEGGKEQLAAALGQMQELKPKPTDHPVIVFYAGNVSLRSIPEVKGLPKTLELVDESKSGDWFENWFEEHPDFPMGNINSKSGLVNKVNQKLSAEKKQGIYHDSLIKRSPDDYRYLSICHWWDSFSR